QHDWEPERRDDDQIPLRIGQTRAHHKQNEARDVEHAVIVVEYAEEKIELAIEPAKVDRADPGSLARRQQERERREEGYAHNREAPDRAAPGPRPAAPQHTHFIAYDQHAVDHARH